MEIDEYEARRVFGGVIREGGNEYRGTQTFEPRGDDRTVLTIGGDIPGLDESLPIRSES
jgi:hypothetical protein